MYTDRLMATCWRGWFKPDWNPDGKLPAITLSFMPISHVMGRQILYSTLGVGGTAYFAARSDLSTLLEDLALVRPTKLDLVPRIWEMLFQEVQSEVDRRSVDGTDREAVELQVMAEQRENLIGGRHFSALTGSAPISPELFSWVEEFLDIPLTEVYGSTEDGIVLVDGQIQRPPVIEYKLADVSDLGYFATDRPHPRGELLVKTPNLIPGYYKRPEVTAELFDADGWYHTGDVVAEIAPDHLVYVDRRNNVLKLSQGEFVTVSKLEAAYGGHPSVRQIFVYGNSTRSYLLAVIVPTDDALASVGGDVAAVKALLSDALQTIGREAGLQSYEIPRDFIVETDTVHLGERPADRHPQTGPPQAQGALRPGARAALHRPGRQSGRCAAFPAQGRSGPADGRNREPGSRCASRRGRCRRRARRGVHRTRW